jgi:hypothetical protein
LQFGYSHSEEDYQYGSADEGEEPQDDLIAIENAYYEGDDCRQEEPAKALEVRVHLTSYISSALFRISAHSA